MNERELEAQARSVTTDDDCWVGLGYKTPTGYRRLQYEGRTWSAHRLMHTLLVGPILDGFHIDHLCRNPPCCNPAHLEVVTPWENWWRGQSVTAENARRVVCKNGHVLVGDNVYADPRGGRGCVECRRDTNRRWRADDSKREERLRRHAETNRAYRARKKAAALDASRSQEQRR